ncbi:MAG: hypothetical protein E7425_09165 [Ruminococcaceae bacterium]|jgi:hypothetical protein|nr:hypothetical protein [Oscillospiraceae bacterium]
MRKIASGKARKAGLPVKLLGFFFRKHSAKNQGKKRGCLLFKVLGKLLGIFAAIYAVLFAVFFFDLDGKLLFYVVEPFLVKHYDKMERKNPLDMPYEIK